MSTGTVATTNAPRGAFDPGRVNFYCLNCRSFVVSPPGTDSMRACPTPGCKRPTGFGAFQRVPRPTAPAPHR